ncbi:MAG: hypothetical protein H6712_06750 [Myxococcales bacterium]|nr:hypothetical protein [Myxococcales bacterium]MCB9713532.1 hypothetical protein [Myxococcales bacterium]
MPDSIPTMRSCDPWRPFAAFMAWHLALQSTYMRWVMPGIAGIVVMAVMVALAVLTSTRRGARVGVAILLAYQLALAVARFPLTANSSYLTVLVLGVLLLLSSSSRTPRRVVLERGEELRRTVLFVLMVIYAMAGVQKLAQGYWHDGEFIVLTLLADLSFFAESMRHLLELGALLLGSAGPLVSTSGPWSLGATPLLVPDWLPAVAMGLSLSFVLAELLVPLAVLWPRTRARALAPLVVVQVGIGLSSWEIEFMSLALGCVALSTRRPRRNLAIVLAGEVVHYLLRHRLGVEI